MKFARLFGWGVVVYAILYLLIASLSLYGLYPGTLSRIVTVVVLASVLLIAGISLRANTAKDILPYSLVWMLEVVALDAILSVPFTGWALYLNWNVWVGYALVVFVPLLALVRIHQHDIPRV